MKSDPTPRPLGGVIHTYQKYDPAEFPSPLADPPDLVTPAFEHMLAYGSTRELSEEELARAIKLDPSQIPALGPSLEALQMILKERKRRILETYETDAVQKEAHDAFHEQAKSVQPPGKLTRPFKDAVRDEQLHDLEMLWYASGDERGKFARDILHLTERLGEKYQVDELASKYDFTGDEEMTVPQALEIKRELEEIDKLLDQLKEAAKTAQIGVIDMDELMKYVEPGDVEQLGELHNQIQELMKQEMERQGIEQAKGGGMQLSPKAYKLFQGKLLGRIFEQMQASRTGRHAPDVTGEGATEIERTKPYEFGDSVANIDIPQTMLNAMLREPGARPIRLKSDDIVVHKTRNTPKAATCVLLDMSGSMRHGLYVDVKRMGLALDGLIRKEYPGDFLQFIEMYSLAKPRHVSEVPALMPKPPTIYDPVVRLVADMGKPNASEYMVPQHFTNIQHALNLARRYLSVRDTPNRQIALITDGLPTAHFEENKLYLLYPPDPRTEQATMREAHLCQREGITINIFLLSNWNQTRDDIRFANRMAEATKGRVIHVAGRELDRYVVWDYVSRKKQIIG